MPDLEDLYREIILDHYRNPRNRGTLQVPPAVRAEGYNPLCGDEVVVYIDVQGGTVSDIRVDGQGCSISQSSASMMSSAVKGRPLAELQGLTRAFKSLMSIDTEAETDASDAGGDNRDNPNNQDSHVKLGDLEALRGVVKFPVRIKCATLCWNTLTQALQDALQSATDTDAAD